MTYDYELTLIQQTNSVDDEGIPIIIETETTILGGLKSVGRSEFYGAAAAGLRPELVFVIHSYEYNEEKIVKFDDTKYDVIRTYAVDFEEIELTCSRR